MKKEDSDNDDSDAQGKQNAKTYIKAESRED